MQVSALLVPLAFAPVARRREACVIVKALLCKFAGAREPLGGVVPVFHHTENADHESGGHGAIASLGFGSGEQSLPDGAGLGVPTCRVGERAFMVVGEFAGKG